MKRSACILVLLGALCFTATAALPYGMNEPLDAREFVFGCAVGVVPGHPGFLPGAGALRAVYDDNSRLGAALWLPELAAGTVEMNHEQFSYVSPVSDSLRLGTLAVELRRTDTGSPDFFREVGFSLGLGWSVGLGTRVILPEGQAASAEDLIQRALDDDEAGDDDGEIEEYIDDYAPSAGNDDSVEEGDGGDIEEYEENPEEWISQPPEYRPSYYLGLDLRYFSVERLRDDADIADSGDQGFGIDLSVAVPLIWRRLYLSFGLTNFIQPNIELDGVRELAPRELTGSLGLTFDEVILAVGARTDFDGNVVFSGATEALLFDALALRAAYHGTAPYGGLYTDEVRAGLGLRLGSFEFDTAVGLPLEDDGGLDSLSVSLGLVL
ncbi:MAG: hypothetical protein GF403_02815 [Candidatus Coatesbacteria bacterium]|nr:hypothetical protein [Candidatus Coatesbacteria bacterium]